MVGCADENLPPSNNNEYEKRVKSFPDGIFMVVLLFSSLDSQSLVSIPAHVSILYFVASVSFLASSFWQRLSRTALDREQTFFSH